MGALVGSWLERLGRAMVPGAAPAVCSLLEDDGSPVPMGPPLAELLAGGVHQQQVEALRAGLAAAFRLADAYKQARSPPAAAPASAGAFAERANLAKRRACCRTQAYQPLLEAAVLANGSVDIAAMETAYTAAMEAPPAAPGRAAGAGSASSADAGGRLESLAGFCALIHRLTEQQASITGLTLEVQSLHFIRHGSGHQALDSAP
jgi:hypothetical protein